MSGNRSVALRKVVRSVAPQSQSATDRELLQWFARNNDQSAFEALVNRHTGMVLGVCRRALPTLQDAEDACQATFLVLAGQAGRGKWDESIANWLYTTARRVASNARVATARRSKREVGAAVPESVESVDRLTGRELLAALDTALDALPARYREPLVLCYLEGLTRDEAAARLGVPLATLHTRIDRARKRLHESLTKSGCALGAGLLALAVTSPAGAVPPHLVSSILTSAFGSPPIVVGELAKAATGSGLGKTVLALAVIGFAAIGVGLGALSSTHAASHSPEPVPPVTEKPDALPTPISAKLKTDRVEVKGVVLGPDDKPVPGAKLFLQAPNEMVPAPQAATNADGTFAFPLDENRYTVLATAPGHGIAWESVLVRPVPALTLRLMPDEPIRGKVVNLEGKPVAGVRVSVTVATKPREDKTLDRWLESTHNPKNEQFAPIENLGDYTSAFAGLIAPATSDRDGKFEIRGLGRDRIAHLRVTGPAIATHEINVVTRKVERFTTRGPSYNEGEVIHGSEPVVVAAPVPVTTGRVLDNATGKPVPGAVLWVDHLVQRNSVIMGLKAVADRAGRFTLPGLPQGKQGLSVIVVPPTGTPYHRVLVTVPDGAARSAFDIRLARGIPATVKIIDKVTREPIKASIRYGVFGGENPNVSAVSNVNAGSNVWLTDSWSDVPHVGSCESEFRVVVFPGKGLLAARVNWLQSGEYLNGIGVEAFEKYRHKDQLIGLVYWSNMHLHEWNTLTAIDVPAGAKEFHFTLELDRGMIVTGRLLDADEKLVTGAESFGLRNLTSRGGSWSAAAEATFTVTALRPGQRRRVMFVHTERKLAGSAVAVGGTKEPLEVRLEPWGEVTGRLVGANGKPVAGRMNMSYEVTEQTDIKLGSSPLCHPGGHGISTGPDGRFRIPSLIPGLAYRWVASGPKNERAIVPDVIPKAGTTDLGDIVVRDERP
ncbi:ECF RNA polymerase sigma factor SigE [Gemmata sp. SH-PL17]|uniref:sigma-70 family RNA polymerase sigma factor n=1 Tax=Gemmata sp. SH-PL17 TaxID=1630693 RepID=UPI0004B1A4D0|nr:sigma-70 family RNA polymerase sigma factor [Gemmata sp. SH-PL17]AMV28513.1 ECF RNA polymerase sigma factor SigE [Gemmata sp. SH-PL17]